MIDWSHLPFLLAASRAGSLSAAARALKVDPATVGRHVSALETEVGAKLLRRKKGGGLEPTEAGAVLLGAASRTEEAIAHTVREVRAQGEKPSGSVRITTVEILATSFVAPRLPELRAKHPELILDMVVTPQILDLSRQVDLALRLTRPTDDALVTRRAGSLAMGVYASRAFMKKRSADQEGLEAVAYGEHFFRVEENAWLDRARGPRIVLRTTSVNAAIVAVEAGLGAGMIPVALAEQRRDLVRLPSLGGATRDVWLAMHPDMAKSPRVRAVADFLCETLSPRG
ncbi:MAG: LysR family transcriptional regulator [Polyangiales bacterium]